MHNETSTGVASRIGDIRGAMDRVGHPALLLVDTISSLGWVDFPHDAWKVDVTVGCLQKGLMLPPGARRRHVPQERARGLQHVARHGPEQQAKAGLPAH